MPSRRRVFAFQAVLHADLRSGSPAMGGKAGPPLMRATGDVVVLFAAWALTMFSSGVPAFNVELEGDSSHLQLSRAQLGHRVGQVPSSVQSAESSPPGDASLTWHPVKASRMDGALQHGPDGRRSSAIWSWAVEVRLLYGPAFGPVSRRLTTTSGALCSLSNPCPPDLRRMLCVHVLTAACILCLCRQPMLKPAS